LLLLFLLIDERPASASVVGTNLPAQSLTAERVAQLPASQRAAWLAYLRRSQTQRQADKAAFQAELKNAGLATPIEPPHGNSTRGIPLNRDAGWYASAEARNIADIIVSFQTPAGGWGKNLDMSKHSRQPGERYGPDNLSHYLAGGDFDAPAEPDWNYIGTIDNDATTTQLNFLARVITAEGTTPTAAWRASFLRGIDYLLAAQYPNGGWPQVWPLEGGYHDAITYNDDAMTQVMELMHNIFQGQGNFAFVPADLRPRAAQSFARGLGCVFKTQLSNNGKRTIWAQQYDPLTLEPTSARNYEPPDPCPAESTAILLLLMNDLPKPSADVRQAIKSGIGWLRKTAIYGQSWGPAANGRNLTAHADAGPLWARYYLAGADTPIFGDRDKSIHDDVNEISAERRNGYGWYTTDPKEALDRFDAWQKEHPEAK
jgi:PelA/Pel-15E family pectate lyase